MEEGQAVNTSKQWHQVMGGCDVFFPHTPYGTQLAFMSKVIAAAETGQNALLEAPTGSGKTLALLCSSLAWQNREKCRVEEGIRQQKQEEHNLPPPHNQDGPSPPPATTATAPHLLPDNGFIPEDAQGVPPLQEAPPPAQLQAPRVLYATRTHSQIAQVVRELKRSNYRPRMTILGSKRHYCVNKVARSKDNLEEMCEELLKEGSCAHFKGVQRLASSAYAYQVHDIEDLCNQGKKKVSCPYFVSRVWKEQADMIFMPYNYLLDPIIRRAMDVNVTGAIIILDEAHNIEDTCRDGASLETQHSKLIDLQTSLAMAQSMNDRPEVYAPLYDAVSRIIQWLDNRHNTVQQQRNGGRYDANNRDPWECSYRDKDLLQHLNTMGLGPDTIDELWEQYQEARAIDEEMIEEARVVAGEGGGRGGRGGGGATAGGGTGSGSQRGKHRVGAGPLGELSRILMVMKLLHQVSENGGRDYRLVVQAYYKQSPTDNGRGPPRPNRFGNQKKKKRGRIGYGAQQDNDDDDDDDAMGGGGDDFQPRWEICLNLWCMNPAVAFKSLAEEAHSVILTSGTLSPLEGFASELGTNFPIKFEAGHVVNMAKQVWAGSLGCAPDNKTPLTATYKFTGEPSFQDSVGASLLSTAQIVPDGMLVFFNSYALLDKLVARWTTTGLLRRLNSVKKVVYEPKGGGNEALQKVMDEYYTTISNGKAAMFLAVCRGKVSEGLDFADKNARAVVIVGIPYPNVKDLKVNLKKEYNDTRGSTGGGGGSGNNNGYTGGYGAHHHHNNNSGMLTGDQWYNQQAFRALNQAIGRCIRHKNDWGAILLLDERFHHPRNTKNLSRWVRGAIMSHKTHDGAMESMKTFFARLNGGSGNGGGGSNTAAATNNKAINMAGENMSPNKGEAKNTLRLGEMADGGVPGQRTLMMMMAAGGGGNKKTKDPLSIQPAQQPPPMNTASPSPSVVVMPGQQQQHQHQADPSIIQPARQAYLGPPPPPPQQPAPPMMPPRPLSPVLEDLPLETWARRDIEIFSNLAAESGNTPRQYNYDSFPSLSAASIAACFEDASGRMKMMQQHHQHGGPVMVPTHQLETLADECDVLPLGIQAIIIACSPRDTSQRGAPFTLSREMTIDIKNKFGSVNTGQLLGSIAQSYANHIRNVLVESDYKIMMDIVALHGVMNNSSNDHHGGGKRLRMEDGGGGGGVMERAGMISYALASGDGFTV